jgi:sRNA-binding protein
MLLLSLTITACDSSPNNNNSNTNSNASANANSQVSPTPVAPTPEPSISVQPQLKAGDKVKVAINGTSTDATVVRVDEKLGKVTVKLEGQSEEKTVSIGDVTKRDLPH